MAAVNYDLQRRVKDFVKDRGLSGLKDGGPFEAFVTYLVFRKYHKVHLAGREIADHTSGSAGDGGIDAVGIFVNGTPILSAGDLESTIPHQSSKIEVEFVFIQATGSAHFDADKIGGFCFGVKQFFVAAATDEDPEVNFSDRVRGRVAIAREIFEGDPYGAKMRDAGGPKCTLYFAATGTWQDGHDPDKRFEAGRKEIEELKIGFAPGGVQKRALDGDSLTDIDRKLQMTVRKERVPHVGRLEFPKIDNVDQAHIVLMKATSFIDLVSTEEGDLNEDLFYENLRDYQGDNDVNSEIKATLRTGEGRHSFPLLNNGVTIVADEIALGNMAIDVTGPQIVNGCQTTHVLFQNKEEIDDLTLVPVKFVVSQDPQVVENVIMATNRQTVVPEANFESLRRFHKDLEDAYNYFETEVPGADRIYYERRSGQYSHRPVREANIITLAAQVKSFVALFLDAPHCGARNVESLLRGEYGLFDSNDKNDRTEPYYASGVALVVLERWIAEQIDRELLNRFRYHLLMLAKRLFEDPPAHARQFNNDGTAKWSLRIAKAARDEQEGPSTWQRAADQLKKALANYADQAEAHAKEDFTEHLLGVGRKGTILWFNEGSGYGRIKTRDRRELLVNYREITAVPQSMRKEGTAVTFNFRPPSSAGTQGEAIDVELDE